MIYEFVEEVVATFFADLFDGWRNRSQRRRRKK